MQTDRQTDRQTDSETDIHRITDAAKRFTPETVVGVSKNARMKRDTSMYTSTAFVANKLLHTIQQRRQTYRPTAVCIDLSTYQST